MDPHSKVRRRQARAVPRLPRFFPPLHPFHQRRPRLLSPPKTFLPCSLSYIRRRPVLLDPFSQYFCPWPLLSTLSLLSCLDRFPRAFSALPTLSPFRPLLNPLTCLARFLPHQYRHVWPKRWRWRGVAIGATAKRILCASRWHRSRSHHC